MLIATSAIQTEEEYKKKQDKKEAERKKQNESVMRDYITTRKHKRK